MEKTQGKFCKKDLLMLYGNVRMKHFEEWIEPIMEEVGWKVGKKQILSPKQVRRIVDYLENPIPLKELNS